MPDSHPADLTSAIEDLAVQAGDGTFALDDLRRADGSLAAVGLSSLGFMTLIEMLEKRFGIAVDPEEDPAFLENVRTIAGYVASQLGPAA